MEFTYRPILTWPGPMARNRRNSQFKASYNDTLALLDRELVKLSAKNLVLQVALDEDDIRLDGRPRSGSRPSHPGVILMFDSKHGPLSCPCDTFNSWEENIRAIALSLEHLRAVDRYGVTKRGEQYTGWKALPPANGATLTVGEAIGILLEESQSRVSPLQVKQSDEVRREAYRAAAMRCHPDRGGTAERFNRLNQAKNVLDSAFGVK